MSYPDNNPKTAIGAKKVPLHLVPPSASHYLALALADGAGKYGPYNWRDAAISVSVYKAAAQRHWDAYWDGEDNAPDSGVHHLAHAMACCALLLDALTVGKLNDDRPTAGAAARLQAEYAPAPNEHRRVATPAELAAYCDNGPLKVGDRVRVARVSQWDGWMYLMSEMVGFTYRVDGISDDGWPMLAGWYFPVDALERIA